LIYNLPSPVIQPTSHTTMAQTIEQLTSTLKKFGISEVRSFPNAYPAYNPVDVYRAHITELLQPITGADPAVIYPAIQWTQTLDKGDVVLPVPALRLKGKKPDEIAKAIESQVRANEQKSNYTIANNVPVAREPFGQQARGSGHICVLFL
jgi:hypothetical protein